MRGTGAVAGEGIRRAAARGLRGAPSGAWVVPEAQDASLATDARAHQVTGPLHDAIAAHDLIVSADAEAAVAKAHLQALTWCLRLEARLLELLDALDADDLVDDGIHPIVVGGPAVAHLDATDPALATFTSLDLLVPPHHHRRAVDVVGDAGARMVSVIEADPTSTSPPALPATVEMAFLDGAEVRIHRAVPELAADVQMGTADAFASSVTFDLGGHEVRAMAPQHRLLHGASAIVRAPSGPTLGQLRTVAHQLTVVAADPDRVEVEAERWGAVGVLSAVVELAADVLDVDLGAWAAWADAHRPKGAERRRIQRLRR